MLMSIKLVRAIFYTLSEAWSGVNRADLTAAQGAFGTDFYARSILRPKHCAYYRSGRPVIKIGPKGALGSHEIRPIHPASSLGQSIGTYFSCLFGPSLWIFPSLVLCFFFALGLQWHVLCSALPIRISPKLKKLGVYLTKFL